jgi:4-hydroxy-3-methylbut-2-enyl diphosphate reductase
MGRSFDIPSYYRSSVVSTIKNSRRASDHRKRDLSPSLLDLGKIRFKIARHFGFCYGVQNAIEIAYRALEENQDKRVFLLSEMIHNPQVNADLQRRGVRFLLHTDGTTLVPFSELRSDDVVIVPAFGTTVELFEKLQSLGINPRRYDTTCPFVEKVWKRAAQLGERGFSVIIHGKHAHEETRATFSHARLNAPSLVIRDLQEAELLASYLRGHKDFQDFSQHFSGRASDNFEPERDLLRIGVVNQTTMLAQETQAISELLRAALLERYGPEKIGEHFADTRDTLCYATAENQEAVLGLLASGGDLALVVGGYNSSNTSHLVELCAERLPTYFIKDADELISEVQIRHLDLHSHQTVLTSDWLPAKRPLEILLTAGASCPDALVDQVIQKVASFMGIEQQIEQALQRLAG